MPKTLLLLAAACLLAIWSSASVLAQPAGMTPHVGGPSGNFLGPPQGNAVATWDGHADSRCPCRGRLTISVAPTGDLVGYWDSKEGLVVLRGSVGYDQNVWTGRFDQPDSDADFPLRGHFRLEARGGGLLTGSYQPEGTTLPFRWSGTR